MNISEWDERYRSREFVEDFEAAPTPLVSEAAKQLPPGRALDLACGTGRNALWLARHGWSTMAVDGSEAAIRSLQTKADQLGVEVETRVVDLTKAEFPFDDSRWDLVLICYYLQRDLLEAAKQAVAPGGQLIAIVHISEPGERSSPHRLAPGELASYFRDWPILHSYEGKSHDPAHKRAVAEIIARRPV